jgi:hypothetical protein
VKITPEQIELGEAISRLVMSWLCFVATLLTTAFFLSLLVRSMLNHDDWAAKLAVGVVDGFLLSLLRIIFKNVFPDRSSAKREDEEVTAKV